MWFFAAFAASSGLLVASSLSAAVVVFLVASPVWITKDLVRDRFQTKIVIATLALLLSGLVLLTATTGTGRSVSEDSATEATWLLLSLAAMLAVLRMAVLRVGLIACAVAFAAGRLLLLAQSGVNWTNPWKYNLALPVAILLLAWVVQRTRGRKSVLPTSLALAGLAVASIGFDYRSLAGMCVLAAFLVLLAKPSRRSDSIRGAGWDLFYALVIALAIVLVNWVGTEAALSGVLGEGIQTRSVYQYDATGSLITGGRPEWTATTQLMLQSPLGYGPGVSAGSGELAYAFDALNQIGIGAQNPYVQVYMFGNGVELHSVIADLWARYGLVGLTVALIVLGSLLRSLIRAIRLAALSGLEALIAVWAIWSLLFGPIYSDAPLVILAVVFASIVGPARSRAVVA